MTQDKQAASAGSRALHIVAAVLGGFLLVAGVAGAEEYGEPTVLTSVDPESGRGFGAAVAIDGDTLAVGDPHSPEGGVVYVYERRERSADGWELVAVVKGRNPGKYERFGASVALEGETLVVGSPYEEARGYQSGAAYVFYRNRGGRSNWGYLRTLLPRDLEERSELGSSVSISGNLVAVGAAGAGTVYVHDRHLPIRNWFGVQARLEGEITSAVLRHHYPWAERADGFGSAVSLSGRTLTVGAYDCCEKADSPPYSSFGVFIFDLLEDRETGRPSWKQLFNFESPALKLRGRQDRFGGVLGLDGPILLAGGAESPDTGSYIYDRNHHGTNRWGYRTELRDSRVVEIDQTGGVAVRGRTAAVGAVFRTTVHSAGFVHGALVYERHMGGSYGSWRLNGEVRSPDITQPARSIAIGPREIVTGHPDVGAVQIFPRPPIMAADFENGDTTGLSWTNGKVNVVGPGLEETDYALAVTVDGAATRSMVRAWQPFRETTVSLGFNLAVNRADLADRQVEVMNLYNPSGDLVRLTLEEDPTYDGYWARLWAWEEGAAWRAVGKTWMPPLRSVRMEVDWRAATGPGHDNGRVRLFTDGRLRFQARNLDTDRQFIGGLLLGLPKGSQGAAGGVFLLDEIVLHR